MKKLAHDFLLNTKISKELYQLASELPIVDYHNHLNPEAMASNKKFSDITELWINDDQYKHRLMRINGIEEKYITGNAPAKEKFSKWMQTFPKTMGNPLFHWSQLEIRDIFDSEIDFFTDDILSIWNKCNDQLGTNGFGAMDILEIWKCEILCTSDDLLDNVVIHQSVTDHNEGLSVFPSLRADSIIAFGSAGYLAWLNSLSTLTKIEIKSLSAYQEAIKLRLDVFKAVGCALSDHGLDSGFMFFNTTQDEAECIFEKILTKEIVTEKELIQLQSFLLTFLGVAYSERNLTMQLHIGAQRTTSSRLKGIAGKFGGFATIGNPVDIESLCLFLDSLERAGALPNTILYTLNPSDNERMATLTGSFSSDGVAGKIQFGPAWWFNDHFDGIKKQLTDVASFGLLNSFIGMTSDSRSFLSLSRHYYFRRVLCHLLGTWADMGLLPDDFETLSGLVKNVCYQNAKNLITK